MNDTLQCIGDGNHKEVWGFLIAGQVPEQAPMEISDNEQDEALLKLNEDELREWQKVDSI